ncbi:MAG: NAD-dependent DNA ligase LigA, partial [Firmicutes bacterium]|nr:NAD-dependent DNA ligase LigA [Bacillota bacterium]
MAERLQKKAKKGLAKMDEKTTQEMKELVRELNKYAYEYYVLDAPSVSDAHYDALYDRLVFLEQSTGTTLPDSPTRRVGGEILPGFKRHTHLARLYSLDKCNTYEELQDWDTKIKKAVGEVKYSLEYKLDGLTLCLTYKDGRLVTAATRGDGSIGEDVTAQVLTIKSVPLSIDFADTVEIQGEGIMKKSAFERYNKAVAQEAEAGKGTSEPLKKPRNGVAGAIRN